MNILAWVLSLCLLLFIMLEAVVLHKTTVCRQKAWLASFNLYVKTTLNQTKPFERSFQPGCRLYVLREHEQVTWQRLPGMKKHSFKLNLNGKL